MKKIQILLVAFLFFTFIGCNNQSSSNDLQANIMQSQGFEISPTEVYQKLKTGDTITLIDVRTIEERDEAYILKSNLIPTTDIEAGTADFSDYNKNSEIIVYCRSGNRSARVYDIMKRLGFKNVKSMTGGINEWKSLGYYTCNKSNNSC